MATHQTSCHSRRSGPRGFGAAVTWGKGKKGVRGPEGRGAQGRSPLRCSPSSTDPASPPQRAACHFCLCLSKPSQRPRPNLPPPPWPQMPSSCSTGPAAALSALPCPKGLQPGTAGKGVSREEAAKCDMAENRAYSTQAVRGSTHFYPPPSTGEKDALTASLS